jgi:hypothetical protein
VAKVKQSRKSLGGRLKATEPSIRGRVKDTTDTSLVCSPSDGQSRRESTLEHPVREPVVGRVTSYGQGTSDKLAPWLFFQQLNQERRAAIPLPVEAGSLFAVNK